LETLRLVLDGGGLWVDDGPVIWVNISNGYERVCRDARKVCGKIKERWVE